MTHDPRCCDTGTCLIDPSGRCWCGQQWDGDKMCTPALTTEDTDMPAAAPDGPQAGGPSQ
jgi:hypothetical protein